MRRRVLLVFLAVGGCSAYRPIAPLDDGERAELVRLRSAMERRPARLVGEPQTSSESVDAFADRGLDAGAPGATSGAR